MPRRRFGQYEVLDFLAVLLLRHYRTFEQAQACLQAFLEDAYTAKSLYSSLEYVPPNGFEAHYLKC